MSVRKCPLGLTLYTMDNVGTSGGAADRDGKNYCLLSCIVPTAARSWGIDMDTLGMGALCILFVTSCGTFYDTLQTPAKERNLWIIAHPVTAGACLAGIILVSINLLKGG